MTMKAFRLFFSRSVLIIVGCLLGCASPYHFSKRVVKEDALRDASAAIATGQLYVCEAGTFDIHATPAIKQIDLQLVQGLPRKCLPGGCRNPEAERSVAYAEIFNREIIRYLEQKK